MSFAKGYTRRANRRLQAVRVVLTAVAMWCLISVSVLSHVDSSNAIETTAGAGACGSGGSCFEPHENPYCDNTNCCSMVCAIDSFCCNQEWDYICVGEAAALCAPPEPGNNHCASGTTLTDAPTSFSTIGATTDGPQHPGCLLDGIGGDIWFNYQATFNGNLTIKACADFPVQLVVYQGCTCPPSDALGIRLACTVGSDFDLCGGQDIGARLTFTVAAGQCYKVRVGGEMFNSGAQLGIIPSVGSGQLFTVKNYCPGDTNDDNNVNIDDLLEIIGTWGAVAEPGTLAGDVATPGGDGVINIDDLLVIIGGWGACPSQ